MTDPTSNGPQVRIHRGAHEIGGNCIELLAEGKRLVLDLGRPLSAGSDEVVPLPAVPGLEDGTDPSLLGVVISHPHQDHYGLLPQVHPSVPVFIGEHAARLINEAAWFSGATPSIQLLNARDADNALGQVLCLR